MKVIYVAGPFRGKNAWEVEKNIRHAEALAFEVNKLGAELGIRRGCTALCPHTNNRFFDGTLTDEFWLESTMVMLKRSCDAIIMTDNFRRSTGAMAEYNWARDNIPTFLNIADLRLWLQIGETP